MDTIEVDEVLYDAYVGCDTVIARFGNEGHEYLSGYPSIGVCPVLTKVAQLAITKGLLDPNRRTGRSGAGTIGQEIMENGLPYQYRVLVGEKVVNRGCVSCKHAIKVGELPVEMFDKNQGLCDLSDRITIVSVASNWYGSYQGGQCSRWSPK
ncbi:MAG: hypothetical protein M0R80_07880 [Proteobacteria bacterium]|nr:hypothetical protein [Pseudomonadota bacterium]